MGMLEQVTRGKVKKPHLVLVYGPDGVGKSTFGADAPNPIFIGSESGTDRLDVNRLPGIRMWSEIFIQISELRTKKHDFKTLVIDSLDWLEPILHRKICDAHGVKSIELAAGGYGKGHVEALREWQDLIAELNRLREIGMNIIVIAHSEVKAFNDPTLQTTYDRYQLKLNQKASALFREYVDTVLFANSDSFAKKDSGKTRVFSDGETQAYTRRTPGYDAKNRMGLPPSFKLSWSEYEKAVATTEPENLTQLKENIGLLLSQVKDTEVKTLAYNHAQKAGDNLNTLNQTYSRLKEIINEQGA